MKFSCNSCNTRYSLPDDRFAGKVITLTCKKCGAKIVVKPSTTPSTKGQPQDNKDIQRKTAISQEIKSEKISLLQPNKVEPTKKSIDKKHIITEIEQAPDKAHLNKKENELETKKEAKREVLQPSKRAEEKKESVTTEEEEAAAVWYYSRGGQQKGPFTDEEILELVNNNVITPKTFVWKDGMMDWMRAGTVAEFRHFFEGGFEKEQPQKNAIASLGLDELDRKFKEVETGLEKRETKEEVNEKSDVLQDEFFSREVDTLSQKSTEVETDWTKVPSINETVEEPRENTRIVIMKAGLSESAKRKRMMIRIITAILLISVFLFVFIKNLGPILSAVGVQIKSNIDLEMEDLDKDTLSTMTPEEREKYRKALLGIKENKKLTKEQKRSIAMAITQKKDSNIADILASAKVESGNIVYENLGRERMGLQGISGPSLDIDSKLAKLGINTKIEDVDLSSKVERQDIDFSKRMPERVDNLNEDVFMMVVNKNKSSVKYCYERHLKASSFFEGKAMFKITVQSSGVVSKVESLSKQIAGTLFEECIIKEIKKWTFPKFTGEPITFEVPFVLTSAN